MQSSLSPSRSSPPAPPPLKPTAFANTAPAFDPVTFWTGHTSSWGVIENRDGAPTAIVTTTTDATPEGPNGLLNVSMEQWMYLADNGTLLNRTIITKLGVRLAEISEQFVRSNENK